MKTYLSLEQRSAAYLALLVAFEIPRKSDHSLTPQQAELKGYAELVTFGQETAPRVLQIVEALEDYSQEHCHNYISINFESLVKVVGCEDTALSALKAFGAAMYVGPDGSLSAVKREFEDIPANQLVDVEIPEDFLTRAAYPS